jgi:hypothetical protein
MTKLIRFFGACALVVSLFSFALAGDTPTPPVPPPPPAGCASDYLGTDASAIQQPDLSDDIVTAVDLLATWIVASIQ